MSYYIRVTFDTERIKQRYENASQDAENPTEIEASLCYMVASSHLLTGTHSNYLNMINRGISDNVRFFGASASNNFEDATMIYAVSRESRSHISKKYSPVFLKNMCIAPGENGVLPPNIIADTSFCFFELKSWFQGEKKHDISFVLYDRDQFGKPSVYGYFNYSAVFNIRREK